MTADANEKKTAFLLLILYFCEFQLTASKPYTPHLHTACVLVCENINFSLSPLNNMRLYCCKTCLQRPLPASA